MLKRESKFQITNFRHHEAGQSENPYRITVSAGVCIELRRASRRVCKGTDGARNEKSIREADLFSERPGLVSRPLRCLPRLRWQRRRPGRASLESEGSRLDRAGEE